MKGIILAAGKGSRLNGTLGDKPKCLLRIGGRTLVGRQIEALRGAGITDIGVVVGCQADAVRRDCGRHISFVENSRFAQTNSLYSLWLARPLLIGGDGAVVMNCDVVFHPQLLHDLISARHEDALLISYQDDDAPPFGDEEMKIKVRRGRVVDIAKTLPADEADGENLGVLKFGADGARLLAEILDRRVAAGALRDWAPRAFADFARLRPLHAIGTRGLPWTEIDFPEDYQRAVNEILPAIDADRDRHESNAANKAVAGDTTVIVRTVRLQADASPDVPPDLWPAVNE
jgi:L-glutamine-phosphate cytidylyltransferase